MQEAPQNFAWLSIDLYLIVSVLFFIFPATPGAFFYLYQQDIARRNPKQ
jgi:hypothetical protein